MIRWITVLPIAALLVVGCAHQKEAKKDQPMASNTAGAVTPPAPAPASTAAATCSSDLECGAKQLCIRQHCVDVTADLAECSMLRVHFALNSAEIDPNDKSALERSARCLKADHALHVTIEGNADERGTEEYNLALGDRRATAVAKWIESLGASPGQLKTVSYGKENPLCTEHDEECWSKNRRASVKTNAGSSNRKPGH